MKGKPYVGISLLFLTQSSPGRTFQSNRKMAMDSTYPFISYAILLPFRFPFSSLQPILPPLSYPSIVTDLSFVLCLSFRPSVRPSIHSFIHSSIHPSAQVRPFTHMSVRPYICPQINLPDPKRCTYMHFFAY